MAARRVVTLDALAARSLARGRSITKDVPARLVRRRTALSEKGGQAHNGQSFPIGVLLRPLLMADRPMEPLFRYQRSGVAWLLRRTRALLADDMGLGKTLQTIAALRRLLRNGAVDDVLVVAARTLLANWEEEFARWAPELAVTTVRPEGARRSDVWKRRLGRAHVIITSYEQVRSLPSVLVSRTPSLVIADEAHKLRNSGSKTVAGFRRMRPERLWLLTGTPVERDPDDLATLLSLLEPSRFSRADARLGTSVLRSRARPYVLRREKKQVLADLPPVLRRHEVLDLSGEQRAAYREAIRAGRAGRRHGNTTYLALFTKLRMICDIEPASGSSSKLDRIHELLEEVRDRSEKAIVFSYTLEPLRALARRLADAGLRSELFTGELDLAERTLTLERFRCDHEVTALLASSRVASEGLTLIEANNVLFVNRWWNPSSNQQAEDRVVRVGQELPVSVYNFTCRHTVEALLDKILVEKGLTFEELVTKLTSSIAEVDELFGDGFA